MNDNLFTLCSVFTDAAHVNPYTMYNHIIKANWQDSGAKIQNLITPFASHDNFALVYNTDPEIDTIYFATTDQRIIVELETAFELEEVSSIDYETLTQNGSSPWEVKGNEALVNA